MINYIGKAFDMYSYFLLLLLPIDYNIFIHLGSCDVKRVRKDLFDCLFFSNAKYV